MTLDDRSDEPMQWTPDARTIVFHSSRPGGWGIFKQRVDEVTADLLAIGASRESPRVTPDGGWVLYARDRQLMHVPVAGGPSELVLEERGPIGADCAKSLTFGTRKLESNAWMIDKF